MTSPPPVLDRPGLPGGPYLVAGLARSGVAVALALAARGEAVGGCDSGPVDERQAAALREAGVAVRSQDDGVAMLDGVATLVKSPGVPQEAPVVVAARERGLTVVGELEVAWRLLAGHPFIAVTGSNGKTTTTELTGHLLRAAGIPVAVAGNVGTALSSLVGRLPAGTVVVCEASSFQLEDTLAFAPEAAVLLNLATDHLDRHGTVEAYHAAKLQAFARQPAGAIAVAPAHVELPGAARRVEVGERDGSLVWDGDEVVAVDRLALRGAHNVLNARAAAAAALAWGADRAAVARGLETFPGVPHRLEEVATVGGVLYVNDSKATNVDAALTGLTSFASGVHLILGGRGKGERYDRLAPEVAARCAAVHLIGEEAGAIARDLAASGLDGREPGDGDAQEPLARGVPVHRSGDLDRAVSAAASAARPGDVVLLSPACASFDQFVDYERRGDRFRELVRGLERASRGPG